VEGKWAAHCKVWGLFVVICVKKTAEPIEMPFGMWNRVRPRKHVLDGVTLALPSMFSSDATFLSNYFNRFFIICRSAEKTVILLPTEASRRHGSL